jgi:hypothetical protein
MSNATPPLIPKGGANMRERPMKLLVAALVAASCTLTVVQAVAATADDKKWIDQCVADNKGGGATDVVLKYCSCMNNKMSDNETQSISQWEKAHVAERTACDKEAGWK